MKIQKRLRASLLTFSVGLTSASLAQAQHVHEIAGQSNSQLKFSGGGSILSLDATYQYGMNNLLHGLQLGGRLGFNTFGESSMFSFMALGTYNFLQYSNIQNAYFVYAGLGLQSNAETNFQIELGGGKRILIVQNVIWKPEVRMIQSFGGSFDFVLVPLSISVLFTM